MKITDACLRTYLFLVKHRPFIAKLTCGKNIESSSKFAEWHVFRKP